MSSDPRFLGTLSLLHRTLEQGVSAIEEHTKAVRQQVDSTERLAHAVIDLGHAYREGTEKLEEPLKGLIATAEEQLGGMSEESLDEAQDRVDRIRAVERHKIAQEAKAILIKLSSLGRWGIPAGVLETLELELQEDGGAAAAALAAQEAENAQGLRQVILERAALRAKEVLDERLNRGDWQLREVLAAVEGAIVEGGKA